MNKIHIHEYNGYAATVEIDEANGAGETLTHNITNANMGSVDATNLDPVSYPIIAGERSYVKYQKFHVTAMGGSSKVSNLKVWRTGALGANASHITNARTTSYAGAITYAEPVDIAVTDVDQTMPTSEPASANLGIGGSLAGELTTTGSSDYLAHQLTTTASAVAGATMTQNYQYDEIA